MRSIRTAAAVTTISIALLGAPISAQPAVAAAAVPYTDHAVTGSVGLCDPAGRSVTHGNINDKPFVWRAVSSTPAVAPFTGPKRKATLLAYQPRPDANPSAWSGDTLTSSSIYTNPTYPMAQATVLDFSLKDFLHEFAPMWDGLIQLRIYLGAPGQGTYSDSYPATDIRVTGDTWTVVRGTSVVCTNGSATAQEVVPASAKSGPTGSSSTAKSGHHPAQTSSASSSPSRSATASTAGAAQASDAAGREVASQASSRSGGSAVPAILAVAGLAMLAIAGTAFWWRRRGGGFIPR